MDIKYQIKEFIKTQIKSFNGKRFLRQSIKDKSGKYKHNGKFLYEIKNNKCHPDFPLNDVKPDERRYLVYRLLVETLKHHKIKDTIIMVNVTDSYGKTPDIPCFNWAIPDGIPGLIFPHFDTIYFSNGLISNNIQVMDNSDTGSIDEIRKTFYKMPTKRVPIQDVYFKGGPNTIKNNKIREMLEESKKPMLNVNLNKDDPRPIYELKDHKYLLDLPGVKPQSLRLKYLFFTGRPIIRISFFNSQYNEHSYWKQFIDAFITENVDYIHLQYDFDYYFPLTKNHYSKIEKDIIDAVKLMEEKPALRKKIADNGFEIGKNITWANTMYYIKELLNTYTDELLTTN